MITKKICMIGAFSVGKTSLVDRYVHSIFSDQYLSTVGVKISKKAVMIDSTELSLVLWDMEGKDDYQEINLAQLRGAMGVFLVADGLRRETLDVALSLRELSCSAAGNVPHILLVNKVDMADAWEVTKADMIRVEQEVGIPTLKTSAKTGQGVDEAFLALARAIL